MRKPIIIDKELRRHQTNWALRRYYNTCVGDWDELQEEWFSFARFSSRDFIAALSESIHERSRK